MRCSHFACPRPTGDAGDASAKRSARPELNGDCRSGFRASSLTPRPMRQNGALRPQPLFASIGQPRREPDARTNEFRHSSCRLEQRIIRAQVEMDIDRCFDGPADRRRVVAGDRGCQPSSLVPSEQVSYAPLVHTAATVEYSSNNPTGREMRRWALEPDDFRWNHGVIPSEI